MTPAGSLPPGPGSDVGLSRGVVGYLPPFGAVLLLPPGEVLLLPLDLVGPVGW